MIKSTEILAGTNAAKSNSKFGTFAGVFTPTILTIIGVILYLRLGWVIGSVGLGGAVLIIVLAHIATITTGLSLASMATNIKIGAGGFYALFSRSLGPEIGGAIGLPLYVAQALGTSLYIIGFSEAWGAMFPAHNLPIVSFVILLLLLLLSYLGAGLAMKVQYIIMLIIVLSIISFASGVSALTHSISIGDLRTDSFWEVFAVFFPAVTGIGAGAAMSGDLKNPKRSLPLGILSAVALGLIVYIASAFWLSGSASLSQLKNDKLIFVHSSRWSILALLGIMGATLSSALGSLIAAPRILQALAQDRVIFFTKFFGARTSSGEPRNATLFTGLLVALSLFAGDLNSVASLLTMFFLVSYGMINLAVFIEKAIAIPSFRPSFSIPLFIPFSGAIWCIAIMFILRPVFAVVSILFIVFIYFLNVKRNIKVPFGDVRSGLFIAIAEWAAKISYSLPHYKKSWKPDLLIPVENPGQWEHLSDFVKSIIYPSGTIRFVSVNLVQKGVENKVQAFSKFLFSKDRGTLSTKDLKAKEEVSLNLNSLTESLKQRGVFAASTVVDSKNFISGISISVQTIKGMFFPPNILFFTMSEDRSKDKRLKDLIAISIREKLGISILSFHPQKGFASRSYVNVWLRTKSPNKNLAILTALQLERNWNCRIRLLTVSNAGDSKRVKRELHVIMEKGRLHRSTEILILTSEFFSSLKFAPKADLNIFGISGDLSTDVLHDVSETLATSCLFVMDSGLESIYA